jgi:hypothetical protein
VLKELGVDSPFFEFSKMVDSPSNGVYVESMFHKVSIEVNHEEDTEKEGSDLL